MGTLFLVATPIGNLDDITLRALRVLREVSLVAAEDTRHTALLLRHFGITTPLLSYHAHNLRARQAALLGRLSEGDVALVSDAGTPALSDPGFELVTAALAAGHQVVPVPGASALLAAVTASGMVPDQFTYLGFLPRKASAARHVLAGVAHLPHPLVLFEAPHRLVATLALLLELLGDRPATAARELTKLHEEFRRATLADLLDHYRQETPRGEFVLIVGGAPPTAVGEDDARALLQALLAQGWSPSQAAREAARQTGLPRQQLYRLLATGPTAPADEP
jgi:16S rRNA (cytidine1402-2'-O)-methyltransferase